MRPARASMRDARGFTLVELLVAMTLLGFLTVLLFGGLRFGARAWESAQTTYAGEHAMRDAQSFLLEAVSEAYPMPVRSGDGSTHVDFDGEAHSMAFLSPARDAKGALARLRISAAANGETQDIRVSSVLELAGTAQPRIKPLLSGIVALDIAYLGRRAGEKAAAWSTQWRNEAALPSLVRIRVRMRDPRLPWQDLFVAPRVVADVDCVLDLLTGDCQGRP